MRGDAGIEESAETADEHEAGVDLGLGLPHVQAAQQAAESLLGSARVRFELSVVIVRLRQRRAQLERAREGALGLLVPLRDVRAVDLVFGEHAFEASEGRPRRREAIVGRGALAVERARRQPRLRLAGELVGLQIETVRDFAPGDLGAVARR